MNIKLDLAKVQANYSKIMKFLVSASFRVPMKKFIDDHCHEFENKLESKHDQFKRHVEFKELVETLLSVALNEAGMNEDDFIVVAKIGLERENDRPYFEQIISCENYLWFKNCMIKRNLQLKEQSLKLMYVNKGDLAFTRDSTINKMLKQKDEAELELAIAMSLAAEDEKKKLYDGKNEIELSVKILFRIKLMNQRF